MAKKVKVFASVPRAHVKVEGENGLYKAFLGHAMSTLVPWWGEAGTGHMLCPSLLTSTLFPLSLLKFNDLKSSFYFYNK